MFRKKKRAMRQVLLSSGGKRKFQAVRRTESFDTQKLEESKDPEKHTHTYVCVYVCTLVRVSLELARSGAQLNYE